MLARIIHGFAAVASSANILGGGYGGCSPAGLICTRLGARVGENLGGSRRSAWVEVTSGSGEGAGRLVEVALGAVDRALERKGGNASVWAGRIGRVERDASDGGQGMAEFCVSLARSHLMDTLTGGQDGVWCSSSLIYPAKRGGPFPWQGGCPPQSPRPLPSPCARSQFSEFSTLARGLPSHGRLARAKRRKFFKTMEWGQGFGTPARGGSGLKKIREKKKMAGLGKHVRLWQGCGGNAVIERLGGCGARVNRGGVRVHG